MSWAFPALFASASIYLDFIGWEIAAAQQGREVEALRDSEPWG